MTEQAVSIESLETAPMAGRRLYSPGTLAAYTVLTSLPVGLMLYGLNLRTRGQRRIGLAMIVTGAVGLALFMIRPSDVQIPLSVLVAFGVVGALSAYYLERRPFELAIRDGARVARWWPPAVLLLLAYGIELCLR